MQTIMYPTQLESFGNNRHFRKMLPTPSINHSLIDSGQRMAERRSDFAIRCHQDILSKKTNSSMSSTSKISIERQSVTQRDANFKPKKGSVVDIDFEAAIHAYSGGLYRRKDFLDREAAAKSHPNRTYYFRKDVDDDMLEKACSLRISADPSDPKPLCIRASIRSKKGKFQGAIDDFSAALSIQPSNFASLYGRGVALEKSGHLQEAIEDFSKILNDVDPGNYAAAYARADCYNRLGDFEAAIRDYDFALLQDKTKVLRPLTPRSINGVIRGTNVVAADEKKIHKHQSAEHSSHQKPKQQKSPVISEKRKVFSESKQKKDQVYNTADKDNEDMSASWSDSVKNEYRREKKSDDSKHYLQKIVGGTNVATGGIESSANSETMPLSPGKPLSPHFVFAATSGDHERLVGTNMNFNSDINAQKKNPQVSENFTTNTLADKHHQLGFSLRKQGRYAEAIAEYTRSLDLRPNNFKALFNRGFALDKLQRFSEAIHDYSRALSLDSSNAYAYYNRGISLDRSGDFDGAIRDFSEAIALMPGKADFHHNRGFCYRKRADFELSIIDYTAALSINPNHFKAVHNRAFAYSQLGQLKNALNDYTLALKLDPRSASAHYFRGAIYDKLGDLDAALLDFTASLELEPTSGIALNARGLVLAKKRRQKEALADFSAAITCDPINPTFFHNRGFCHRTAENWKQAREDFTKVIELDSTNATARSNRGYVWRKLGQYDRAIVDYSEAIKLDSSNSSYYSYRGYTYIRQKKFQKAIVDYTKAILLDGRDPSTFYNRAIAFEQIKCYRKAIDDFNSAISLEPTNTAAILKRDNLQKKWHVLHN